MPGHDGECIMYWAFSIIYLTRALMLVSSIFLHIMFLFPLRKGSQVFGKDTLPTKVSIWRGDTPSISDQVTFLCSILSSCPHEEEVVFQGWQMTMWHHPSPSVFISFLQFQQINDRKGCSFVTCMTYFYYLLMKTGKVPFTLPLTIELPIPVLTSCSNYLEEVKASNWNLTGKFLDHIYLYYNLKKKKEAKKIFLKN